MITTHLVDESRNEAANFALTAVERKIDEKIPQFIDRVKKHPSRKHQAHDLSLYPSMRSKTSRPHGSQTKFNVTTGNTVITESSPKERDALHLGLELSLCEVLFQIINFGSEIKDHIPPLSNLEGAPFPFQITISSTLPCRFSSLGLFLISINRNYDYDMDVTSTNVSSRREKI
ncbi:hypothetical protein T459_06675 [Capsicum annuum]|uniref:Uncharacterized protein n=1 Tax=Capsicum annuum TaxID=4072 RepID=A0A2G3ABD0_CAPAN|nr:hypothetical protein T459_06675 [Capsicum annuum]